ncbi:MAG: hypothetical protein HC882_08205, partial [Acidobacteria bacterium]|nr:hypothetical protein [Acidobacteriota bacterium]
PKTVDPTVATGDGASRPRQRRPRAAEPPQQALPEEGFQRDSDVGGSASPPVPVPLPSGGAGEGARSGEPSLQEDDAQEKAAPTSPSQVRLVPSASSVTSGDPLTVDVAIANGAQVSTVNFQLRYNPQVLRFVPPAQLGDFLQQGGVPADLQAVESAEGGLVVVSITRPGQAPAEGAGQLVRLNFIAVGEGEAGFSFSAAQVRGPESQSWPASFRTASVEVQP